MPELIAKSPWQGLAPVSWGEVTLEPLAGGPLWSVALFPGAVAADFPAPGRVVDTATARLVWTGRAQALVFGALPGGLAGQAAVTDQTGAWAGIAISGAQAVDALARLVPLDLRPQTFPPGSVARSSLGHIPALLLRTGDTRFELHVPRSMARSAWEDLGGVLDRLEARAAR